MSKINVLVLPSDHSGVGKYRSVDPHIFLQNSFPDDFHIDIDYYPQLDDDNYWKKYEIVVFHRNIGQDFVKGNSVIQKLNKMGIITVCDIDDYWMPTKDHPIHEIIKLHKINERIVDNIKVSKYVTTTTEIFAKVIAIYNKNVFILPNAINPDEPQFKEPTMESDRVRIGWLGGSSHLNDLLLLNKSFDKVDYLNKKMQFVLCGFDTRGTITEINKDTGEQRTRNIRPEETVWVSYEKIFTQNYRNISKEYKDFLYSFKEEPWSNELNEPYLRVWTKPVTSYAKNYSKFDVSLAPIKDHLFNKVKSQLKVIEAGFYKKALIASDFGPYTIDLKNAFDKGKFNDGNALLVDDKNNNLNWAKYIEKLVKNPNFVKDLGERLYETVKDKYNLNNVTKDRAEFYKTIFKN